MYPKGRYSDKDLEQSSKFMSKANTLQLCMCVCMCICAYMYVRVFACVCTQRVESVSTVFILHFTFEMVLSLKPELTKLS